MSHKWEAKSLHKVLRYDPRKYYAYCKYCYETHQLWWFDGEMVAEMTDEAWLCSKCKYRTSDANMKICNKQGNAIQPKPSMQQVVYKDFTKAMANIGK